MLPAISAAFFRHVPEPSENRNGIDVPALAALGPCVI
jgi:hypothetical protein